MKSQKDKSVKAKVVVRLDDDADGDNTIILYRGGKTGLAFRSPSHRVLRESAQQRCGGEAALSGAPASAAVSSPQQQGGSR